MGATIAGCTRGAQPSGRKLLVRNVSVFDGEQMLDADSIQVENGLITDVGRGLSAGRAEVHDGAGGTLLPGLIDAHAHVAARAHEGDKATADAVRFGVTTMLDMHTTRPEWLADAGETRAGTANQEADVWTAGIGVTAPGSWPDVDRIGRVPTLAPGDDAAAFVAERIAEGSDYIKMFLNEGGLTDDQARAVVAAAHNHGVLAVAHVSVVGAAITAVTAGADALVHVPAIDRFDAAQLEVMRNAGTPVVATALVRSAVSCGPHLDALYEDPRVKPLLSVHQRRTFPRAGADCPPEGLPNSLANVAMLHEAGVRILAGSDAPGVAFGVGLLGELQLLVEAGLPAREALTGATAAAADVFGLSDRGRIVAGKRADLLLINGDPTGDISAIHDIAAIWRNGYRISRER